MALNVGELQATLGINTEGFTSGIKSAQDELKEFQDILGPGVKTASDSATDGMENAQKSANKMGKEIENAGKKSEKAGTEIKKAGDEIKKSGEKSKTAAEWAGKLKEVFGALGVGIGVGTIISKIKELIDKLREAYDLSERAAASFERTIGTTLTGNPEQYRGYIDELITATTYDENTIATVLSKVIKTNPSADPETVKSLTKEYLALGEMGFGGLTSNIDKAYIVFDKWGISAENQSEKLALFLDICRNTNTDMTTLLQTLQSFDFIGQAMGMTLDDAAEAIANTGGNIDDLNILLSKGETLYYKFYDAAAETLGETATTEQIDKKVNDMFNDAIKAAEDMPESQRAKFWASLFGEEGTSGTSVNFAKAITAIFSGGGKTFSSDVSASELYLSTLTTAEKASIANSEYYYELGQRFGGGFNDIISKSSQLIMDDYDDIHTSLVDVMDDIEQPQITVNNVVNIESSDPYTTATITQTQAVASVNNPTYGGY